MRIVIVLLATIGFCYADYFTTQTPMMPSYYKPATMYSPRTINNMPTQRTNMPVSTYQQTLDAAGYQAIPQASIPVTPMDVEIEKVGDLELPHVRPRKLF